MYKLMEVEMKRVERKQVVVLGMILALGLGGCSSKKSIPLTEIPNAKTHIVEVPGPPVPTPGLPPTPGIPPVVNPLPTGPVTPIPPIVTNNDQDLNNFGQLKENRDAFAAQMIHFEYDSAAVMPEDVKHIEMVARHLEQNMTHLLVVEGHCDERGTEEYNRSLGERRALAVREELVRMGIAGGRIRTISYGEDIPLTEGASEQAWRENRRGEFVLMEPAAQ